MAYLEKHGGSCFVLPWLLKHILKLFLVCMWLTDDTQPGVMQTPGILNDVLMPLSMLCMK